MRVAVPEVEPAIYENDEVMAELGRQVIDQYIGWSRKYGEPKNLAGWASFIQLKILGYMEDSESEDDTGCMQRSIADEW